MNEYEMKQEERRERYLARAERLEKAADALLKQNQQLAAVMNGQPILVGHHSEKRHRRDLERMHNRDRRAFEALNRAKDLRRRAESIGSGGISSDDPDAVAKLREKLARMEEKRETIKRLNRAIRRLKGDPQALASELDVSVSEARRFLTPDYMGRVGIPRYVLSNLGANIRRVKQRIEQLEAAAQAKPKEEMRAGVRVVEDPEDNRLRLFFPGKPSPEVRRLLKSMGFRWAPSVGAWQRHLNNAARAAADGVLDRLPEGAV